MGKFFKEKIYEGSSKIIYRSHDENALIQFFKDDIKIDFQNTIQVSGKGILNNTISNYIFNKMNIAGVNHHLIQKINMREQLIYALNIIPVKVFVTSIASGRYVNQFGIEEGCVFDSPIIDFRINSGTHEYPAVNEDQMLKFNWIDHYELKAIKHLAIKAYTFLAGLFASANIRLVECQLEFGRIMHGEEYTILLADEITPDTCKLWDLHTNCKLGYEQACAKPEHAITCYQEIVRRLNLQESFTI